MASKQAMITLAAMMAATTGMHRSEYMPQQKRVRKTYNDVVTFCPTCNKKVFAKEIVKRFKYHHIECKTTWEVKK